MLQTLRVFPADLRHGLQNRSANYHPSRASKPLGSRMAK